MCTSCGGVQDPQREKTISDLLGGLGGPNSFDKLVALGKRMTDYAASEVALAMAAAGGDGDALDDEIGVAVEFEGEDEDEDSEGDEVLVHLPTPSCCCGTCSACTALQSQQKHGRLCALISPCPHCFLL